MLMDIAMPGLNGLEATRQIRRHCPHTKVVILSMHANDECICEALRAGASGYVVKEAAVTELASAIRAISRGDSFFSPSIYRKVIEERIRQAQATQDIDSYDRLSDRQKQVLRLIVDGFSNRQIAQALQISVKTVETHRALLMDRLGLHTLPELVKYAIRKGIVGLDRGWRKAPSAAPLYPTSQTHVGCVEDHIV